MASSGGTDGVGAPLLAARSDGGRGWKKVVDVEEGKIQMVIALPMVLTNVFYYIIPLVSVMFAGHLGELQLAASTLANSWATVTGYAFMLGLSGALETLCGQAFGARCYKMLGVHLQSACIISFLFSIIISIIWWYTEPILIFLHQNPDVSKQTAIFLRHLIPGIFAFGTIQNILRFLQTQSVVYPLVICSLVPLLLHLGLTYVLVHFTPLGFRGAALSTSIAFWISALMLIGYMNYGDKFKQTWRGLSKDSLNYVLANLKLGLPSAAMVCLEYWAFEILVLLAGLSPNSETSTSLIAMCVNTEAIAFNFTYGLSAAVSTRVSNELGATRPEKAKQAMGVTLKLSVVLTCAILVALGFGHELWASLFSDSPNIIKAFSSMTPLLCISIVFDSIQGILSGVCRGCGWQHLAMFINLGTFYGIGMPIAVVFGLVLKFYAKGLWIGLLSGLGTQSFALFLLTCFKKWTALEFSSHESETSELLA